MDKRAVFHGDYCGLRCAKSRKVAIIEIEIPIERFAEFVAAFGGPDASTGVPVALARIDPNAAKHASEAAATPAKAHRDWNALPLAQQAGIRCADKVFVQFLIDRHGHHCEANAADTVRAFCGVQSRAELNTSQSAGNRWRRLDDEFVIWQRYPDMAA